MGLLKPQYLQAALTNSHDFQRAQQLLWLNWPEDVNYLYNNPVQPADIKFARELQDNDLVKGQVDLNDYRQVSQMLAHHGQWFSKSAEKTLMTPFG